MALLGAMAAAPCRVAADVYSGLSARDTGAPVEQAGPLPPGTAGRFETSPVAGAPQAPSATVRPATWPGQAPQYPDTGRPAAPWVGAASPGTSAGTNSAKPLSLGSAPPVALGGVSGHPSALETKRCEDAQIVARVGTEVILAGDVIALFVNERLDELDGPIPDKYRSKVLQAALPRAIQIKLLFLEAKRGIPEENYSKVEKEIQGYFYAKSIPDMMKRAKVSTVDELGQKLVDLGSSLQWQQQLFTERVLGQQWMSMKVKFEGPVSPSAMLAYYLEHEADYKHPARARWEEIMVSFSKCPSREAAYAKIAQLGNQVMNGLPFAEAARRGSDGSTAAAGGVRDWTTQGSLVAEQLDAALFGRGDVKGLPIGQLSPILESESGLHIIRVTERTDAYRTAFTEVQEDIRKTIQKQRGEEDAQAYFAQVKENTPVWTIYDTALAKKDAPSGDSQTQKR